MLFSKVVFLDAKDHAHLRWQCLNSQCLSSCCFIPDRTFIVLEEIYRLSKHFPVVITVEVDEQQREERLLCAYLRLKEDKRGCLYLKDGVGCAIEEEKPYTCRQYPFLIEGGYLAFDLTCPGFSESQGTPLWEGHTINPHLEERFFTYSLKLQEGKAQTQDFINTLFDLNLIVGARLTYENIEVSFNMVQEERLIDLPKDVLRELSSKGYLRAIYAHLNSLQNWEKLIKRCTT